MNKDINTIEAVEQYLLSVINDKNTRPKDGLKAVGHYLELQALKEKNEWSPFESNQG